MKKLQSIDIKRAEDSAPPVKIKKTHNKDAKYITPPEIAEDLKVDERTARRYVEFDIPTGGYNPAGTRLRAERTAYERWKSTERKESSRKNTGRKKPAGTTKPQR